MMLQRILFFTLFILLTCACGAGPQATSAPVATASPTFAIAHEPGVAELWRDPPPAGELVEVDAYFSGATGFPIPGIGRPPLADQVACPAMWSSALTDQPFLPALRLLNGAHSNTLADDAPWLIATIPEATEPGKRVGGDLAYHARFRGRFGEPAFAHCEQVERIFVVEEVVTIYEEQPQEQPAYELELPDGYDNWPRYHDAALGYSVPYPPDWTVESLSEAELLGVVALRAPQWPDYPAMVRVHEGETIDDQYEPSSIAPLLQQANGGGVFQQGGTFEAISETQHLSGALSLSKGGYSLHATSIKANRDKAVVLFSAHGRTYELSLEYPLGFEASQSLLTHFSAIVEGFQLDVPPPSSPILPQPAPEPTEMPLLSQEEVLTYIEEREQKRVDLIDAQFVSEAEARRLAEACGTFSGDPDDVWVVTVRFEGAERTTRLFIDAITGEQLCGALSLPKSGEEILPQAAPEPTLAPNTSQMPEATETAVPVAPTPRDGTPHEPGVADLLRDAPPAGELVEVDAYFSGATGFPMFGGAGARPLGASQVACPTMWGNTLTDHTFLATFRVLNSARTNTLPDEAPWLIATTPEATEPGRSVGPSFPYHARFRGRLGEPAFADCEHAERIFVVEEVVTIYEELAKEPPVYQLELPDGYDNWPRYHDAALGYSVPYPPDWTVEALSEAELLGAVALRAPQWPDYPIIVRVSSGEIDLLQYNPASHPPWLQKPEHGGGMFSQGSGIGQSMPDSQMLSGYSQYWETSPDKHGAAVLFSANGRTYELSLEYPLGFEASQSLLTHFSTIVEGFQFDVPPPGEDFLPQGALEPTLAPEPTEIPAATAVPVAPTPTESIKIKASPEPKLGEVPALPLDQPWIWSVESLPTPPQCANYRGRVMAVDEGGQLTTLPYSVINVIERAKQPPLLMVCLEGESWGLVDTLSWRETPLYLAGAYDGSAPHKLDSKWWMGFSDMVLSPDGSQVAFQMSPAPQSPSPPTARLRAAELGGIEGGRDGVKPDRRVWVADVETGQIFAPFDHQAPDFKAGDDYWETVWPVMWREDGLFVHTAESSGRHALWVADPSVPQASPQLVLEDVPQNYDYREYIPTSPPSVGKTRYRFNPSTGSGHRPAGTHLAYKVGEARDGETPQLKVRDLATGTEEVIAEGHDYFSFEFSPDGTMFAYLRSVQTSAEILANHPAYLRQFELWLYNLEDGTTTPARAPTTLQITYARNGALNWSTDSQRLLVLTQPLEAMIFERDGTHLTTQKRKHIGDEYTVFAHLMGEQFWLLVNQTNAQFWLSHSNLDGETTDEPLIELTGNGKLIYVPLTP